MSMVSRLPKMLVSKAVRDGDVVVIRGNKWCRASHRSKRIGGVWQAYRGGTILRADTGMVYKWVLPAGVAIQGNATVKVKL